MLRLQFEEDIKQLHTQFYEMGEDVSNSIHKAVKSFVKHDHQMAEEVIEHDTVINDCEIKLENKCFEMIALQQPVTSDLRMIVTVMKASSDLERMGDHAVSIARATIQLDENKRIPEIEEKISLMADKVKQMVDEALTAFVNKDIDSALKIASADSAVNRSYRDIYDFLMKKMKENPDMIESGLDYFQVSRFLERIGDYVTNICEWVVYLKTGKISELG